MPHSMVVLFLVLISALSSAALKAEPMVVKHYQAGFTKALQPYMLDVLKLTLDLTEDDYGPYQLIIRTEPLSSARSKVETEKGAYLNVLFGSDWRGDLLNEKHVIGHRFSAFNDLLGLRTLLMGSTPLLTTQIHSAKNFKTLKAGQGFYWDDSTILRHGGVTVVESQTFSALFSMLNKGRFDYLPLSILEAETALNKKRRRYPALKMHPYNNIFYPMNFKLYVNAKDTKLNARIADGLSRAEKGPLLDLFKRHFSITHLLESNKKRALYLISNPAMTDEQNAIITQRFLNNYGHYFQTIK